MLVVVWGISTSPFNWHGGIIPRNPIPVDAIPDIGDNQQIVATEWMGRSPKDIQDQITYPLTTSLLGIPGVKSIRSSSMFGMSFIYIIFDDNIEFYWSRSRILEKLNSLPPGTLPEGVQPVLGPDATALGQIYWYTLEGRDPATGKPTGGWNAEELRTIQDYYVKYSLSTAEGVSEVASAGGFVKEYQVELNPDAMRAFNVSVMDIMGAIKKSNLDIGAETMEINKVEYLIRGLGYIKDVSDLEKAVVTVRDGVPVRISDVAFVNIGPGTRRGGLDKEGVEAVGGVVIARYGSNPLEVINNVKDKIKEMAPGLPQKTLPDGTVSKITVVPFYDRTGLIKETIGTLETSLSHEILICIIVIIVLVLNLRASAVIACMLPIAVLSTFIIMRYTGIAANIVALSGIAIAIGVMVDVGVVFVESIIRYMEMPENRGVRKGKAMVDLIYKAVSEVSGDCHGDDHDYRQFPAPFCNGGTGRKNVLSPRLHENLCAGLCFRIGIDLAADLILYIVFGTDRLKADTELEETRNKQLYQYRYRTCRLHLLLGRRMVADGSPERHYRQSSFRNRMYRHHSCTALVTGDLLRTYPSLVSE